MEGQQQKQQQQQQQQQRSIHLVVLQHGLWGKPGCVSRLEQYLRDHLAAPGPAAGQGKAPQAGPAHGSAEPQLQQPQQQKQQPQQPPPLQLADEVHIINSHVNEGKLTYDGIDVCGARMVQLVLDTLQELQEGGGARVSHLSFVGYSLGGLILRYAVGKLYVLGLFEDVACANFITIASPHLGSWREPLSLWARFFNTNVPIVASRTGRQLMLVDADYSVPWLAAQQALHEQAHEEYEAQQGGSRQRPQGQTAGKGDDVDIKSGGAQQHRGQQGQREEQQGQLGVPLPPGVARGQRVPLLLLMAHPAGPFHRALAGFRTRLLAANIHYDATVPYCTAALCLTNPYDSADAVPVDDRYPSVVRPARASDDPSAAITTHQGRTKRLLLFALFSPFVPLLYTYTAAYGLLHHRWARRQPLEGASWLQQHPATAAVLRPFASISSNVSKQLQQQQQQEPARVPAAAPAATAEGAPHHPRRSGDDAAAVAPGGARATATPARLGSSGLAAALEHHKQQDELAQLSRQLSRRPSQQQQPQQQQGGGNSNSSSSSSSGPAAPQGNANGAAAGAGDEGDAAAAAADAAAAAAAAAALSRAVSVDADGIVEAPGYMQQQQAWMAAQLFDDAMPACVVPYAPRSTWNGGDHHQQTQTQTQQRQEVVSRGGWHRIDVCTRHYHAHAAVIIRDARFEGQSRDVFAYLLDHMSL